MVVKIKKGDKVVVLIGCDKGKIGEVVQVFLKEECVVVCGVNVVKCYQCQMVNQEVGIVLKEVVIYLLNLVYVDLKDGKLIWVGFKVFEDGCKVCFVKCLGDLIDG